MCPRGRQPTSDWDFTLAPHTRWEQIHFNRAVHVGPCRGSNRDTVSTGDARAHIWSLPYARTRLKSQWHDSSLLQLVSRPWRGSRSTLIESTYEHRRFSLILWCTSNRCLHLLSLLLHFQRKVQDVPSTWQWRIKESFEHKQDWLQIVGLRCWLLKRLWSSRNTQDLREKWWRVLSFWQFMISNYAKRVRKTKNKKLSFQRKTKNFPKL